MTTGTALVLLGFGLGALIAASQGGTGADPRSNEDAASLRERAIEAQKRSAVASQRARTLTDQWSAAEKAALEEQS